MAAKRKKRLNKNLKVKEIKVHNDTACTNHIQITEEMLERILYRWYQKYQCKTKRLNSTKKEMEVTVVLKCEDLLSKALSIVEKVNTVENLKEKLDIKWVKRWQNLYGVNRETNETPFDSTQQFINSDLTSDVTVSVVPATEHECIRNGAENDRTNIETSHVVPAKKEENDAESMSINEISNGEIPVINVDMTYPQHVSEFESNIDQQLTNNEIYYAFCFDLDLKYLPDQSYQNVFENDRVSVLMAANRSGGHRTRVLVAGKEWRPNCLKHVNMVTQPVIYAGGGSGSLTSDLFKWWFHKEFSSTTSMFHSNIVLYVNESNSFVSSINDLQSRNVKLKTLNEQEYNYNLVISEFRTIYTSMLLKYFILSKSEGEVLNLETYIKQYSLKDSFLLIHKSWLSIRPETFLRCLHGIKNEPQVDSKLIFNYSGTENDKQGDTNLLLELQWLTHDLGLEVTDQDLLDWISEKYKPEILNCNNETVTIKEEECDNVPSAVEVIKHLEKVLQWMESETFDPNYLLCVQDVLVSAKQASKMGLGGAHPAAAAGLSFFCHNGEHPLTAQPPPAHMGIPPYQLDAKHAAAGMGLSRPPMYSFSPGQYAYPMLSPEMSQVASWHSPSMYPISTAASGPFRSPYPTSLPIPSSSLPSDFYRFSPGLMPPHPGLSPHALASHAAIVTPGPKQELTSASGAGDNHRYARASMDQKNSTSDHNKNNQDGNNSADKKKPHIKKPLNAFMLYMKEMRAKVVAECTLKESAAINQILGRRWHSLSREEQGKYYEKARQERQLHMQLYPGWSARDNYGYGTKKKKRKKERTPIEAGGNSMKKCRARYGLDQQSQWCKPCRRKKKCIRYMETGDSNDGNQSDDNLGSCGSVGEAQTPPDDDTESLNQSLSSPGGLSGLSSLTSPSMILPSPSTSLASPSVSLASPCMSLQSPLTPHDVAFVDCSKPLNLPTTSAISVASHLNHQAHNHNPPQHRNPVGTNPHDINNPLSVNQLTGQCVKNSNSNTDVVVDKSQGKNKEPNRPVISVT